MLIDCDTCTVRGEGCADCVVTVLLGAPPGWQAEGPTVVPLTRRPRAGTGPAEVAAEHAAAPDSRERLGAHCDVSHVEGEETVVRPVVELDEVERRAVRALADFGLVPPLRHQDASAPRPTRRSDGDRHVS